MNDAVRGIVSVLSLSAFFASAGTYVWTGAESDVWDTTAKNWKNESGEAVAFPGGSSHDVLFDDGAERFTVRFTNEVKAGVVVFNVTNATYVLTNSVSGQYISYAESVRKKGPGSVLFHPGKGSLLAKLKDGEGVSVDEGLAEFTGYNGLSALARKPGNFIFVGTNAVLRFGTRHIFSDNLSSPATLPVVIKNGKLVVAAPGGHTMLGPVTFDDGEFDYSGVKGYNANLAALTLSGRLTFKGSTPYALDEEGFGDICTTNLRKFNLFSDPKTEFCVDDITDEQPDLTIGVRLTEHCVKVSKPLTLLRGGLVKSGAGTLALTNANNMFSGDIEVREGTLQVGPARVYDATSMGKGPWHWIGCLTNENRRIVVKSGGALCLPNRNSFGVQRGITNLCGNTRLTLVFDGGTFTNYQGQGFLLPDVEFSNGGSIAKEKGTGAYGRFMVRERFAVKGSVPFVWELSEGVKGVVAVSQEALALNGYPENVFEIDDVTGDKAADATFGIPFIIAKGYFRKDVGDHELDDWKFGFRKTGEGTMRITAPLFAGTTDTSARSGYSSHGFNGDAKVEEGTLQVDGNLSLSDTVRVSAGAFMAGTGIVNNVSLASGGGLRVRDGQADFLRVTGALAAEEGLKVDVLLADGADVRNVKAKVLKIEASGGTGDAGNLTSAVVSVDGVAVPNIRLRMDGGELTLRYMRGTAVVVR